MSPSRGRWTLLLTAAVVVSSSCSGTGSTSGVRSASAERMPVRAGIPVDRTASSTSVVPIATHAALLSDSPPPPPPPVSIDMASLGTSGPVVPVGAVAGELDVPPSARSLGWYRAGPTPGAPEGSAVIAGHVDHAGERGIFFRLAESKVGDTVVTRDATGATTTFVVQDVRHFPKVALPSAELFRSTGPPVLTLITCGGEFRPSLRSYADNVVVTARPATV